MVPVLQSLHRQSYYKTLQKELEKVKETKEWEKLYDEKREAAKGKDPSKHLKNIIEWMGFGDQILAPITQRVLFRGAQILMASLGVGVLTGFDLPGKIFENTLSSVEICDPCFVVLVWIFSVFYVNERKVLHVDEKKFIKNLNSLHKQYYEIVVKRAIKNFNNEADMFFNEHSNE